MIQIEETISFGAQFRAHVAQQKVFKLYLFYFIHLPIFILLWSYLNGRLSF